MTAKRPTNSDLRDLIEKQVLPEIKETKAIATEARELARRAGLNGFASDIHEFFEQRAESQAARNWLARKIKPITRFRAIAFLVGFVASLGWAVMGINSVVGLISQHH